MNAKSRTKYRTIPTHTIAGLDTAERLVRMGWTIYGGIDHNVFRIERAGGGSMARLCYDCFLALVKAAPKAWLWGAK